VEIRPSQRSSHQYRNHGLDHKLSLSRIAIPALTSVVLYGVGLRLCAQITCQEKIEAFSILTVLDASLIVRETLSS
jgi:hypothetical protein